MATVTPTNCTEQIGDLAGEVWNTLDQNGPLALTKLIKEMDAPRDTVMQAVGWLAREDKIEIEEEGRTRIVSLV